MRRPRWRQAWAGVMSVARDLKPKCRVFSRPESRSGVPARGRDDRRSGGRAVRRSGDRAPLALVLRPGQEVSHRMAREERDHRGPAPAPQTAVLHMPDPLCSAPCPPHSPAAARFVPRNPSAHPSPTLTGRVVRPLWNRPGTASTRAGRPSPAAATRPILRIVGGHERRGRRMSPSPAPARCYRIDQKWVTRPSIGRKLWKSPKVFTSARRRMPARPVMPCRPMSFGPTSAPMP